jgi:hypothetical protein
MTEGYGGPKPVTKFTTEAELSNYSLKQCPKRIFPQSKAAGTLLQALLRKIKHPPDEAWARDEFNRTVRVHSGKRAKRNKRR